MKAAVCLHGLARGSSVQADGAFLENYSTLLKKIGGADIFIHSWDEDIKEHLIQTFSPVSNLFESQRKFPKELSFFSGVQFDGDTGINQGDLFKTLSFLYSRKESVRLKKEYEKKNTFKYDVVLVSRFDVGHHNNGLNKTSHLNFDPTLDMSKIYQAYWDQTNAGASDHWFYSNSENIDYLALLYDKLPEHLNKRSEYTKLCKKGWPLSDKEDEFSGELFKEQKSTNLCQYVYEDNVLINNHSLYKFHLMENNLWEDDQAVFLNKNLWHD
tara:strand:+ start:3884 stop:4693 length:810 start_codon:yes stop_codon:yes gene_type:complete